LAIVVMMASCKRAPDEAARVAELTAAGLAKAFATTSHGSSLTVGSHTLTLSAVIEQVRDVPGKGMAAGVRINCAVDGTPIDALAAASVGVGASREAALTNASLEWATDYGAAIVDTLSDKPPSLESGGFQIHAGPVTGRGTEPGQLDDIDQMFFGAVGPNLASIIGPVPGLHAISIMVARNKDGAIDGEFRVDGKISPELATRAFVLPWPAAATPYLLKQYYVLLRR
jgi:hypothetical protein